MLTPEIPPGGRQATPNQPVGAGTISHDDLEAENARLRRELEAARQETTNAELRLAALEAELLRSRGALTKARDALAEKRAAFDDVSADLHTFIAISRAPKIFLDASLRVRRLTTEAEEILPPAVRRGGSPIDDASAPAQMRPFGAAARRVLRTGEEEEFEWQSENEAARDYLVRVMPHHDSRGERRGVAMTFADVSGMRQASRMLEAAKAEAERALVEVEELYRTVPQALALIDTRKRYVRINEKLAQINGAPAEAHLGRTVAEMVPGVSHPVEEHIDRVLASGETVMGVEIIGATPGTQGSERTFEVDFHPFFLRGEIAGVGVCVFDVTGEREMQAEMQRIMRELQHRVKNILANVMAVINQARRTDDPAEAIETLANRIEALAATHNLLSAQNWRATGLHAIARQELEEIYGADRVVITGEPVELSAKAALAVAMAFHEMATNAAKYGALSVDDGRLDLGWTRADGTLTIRWTESGGPRVSEPASQGFGSLLVLSTIERSLGGKVTRLYEPSGFRSILVLPDESLLAEELDQGGANGESRRRTADPLS